MAGMLAILLGAAAGVHAQPATADRTAASSPAERAPEYARPLDIPPDLLRPKKPQAMILPSDPPEWPDALTAEGRSGGVVADVEPTQRILPEGYILGRRPARFGRDESWWAIAIGEVGSLPVGPPIRVLPNRRLMILERALAAGQPDDIYLVTGRVTEFLGRNYVLLENVVAAPARRPAPPAPPAPPPDASVAGVPRAPSTGPVRPPTAGEVLEQLLQEAPVRPVMPRATAPAGAGPVDAADADARGQALAEGTIVPEFPARLLRTDAWWTLARESQGIRPGTPPLRVLPNRLLEMMVSASGGGTRSVVFLVSGELTEYRGTNYLLVHKVLIRRDQGNLR